MGKHIVKDDHKTELNRFLESVGTDCPNLIYNPGNLKVIYHYTDLNGLQGIVGTKDIWLTQSRYSNDDDELLHGIEVVRDAIRERAARARIHKYKEYLRLVAEIFRKPLAEAVYICCFCEVDNLLSQWRSYSANGTGVSIGFDPARFSYITGQDSPPSGLVRLWKVFYDRKIQKALVIDALEFAYRERSDRPLADVARQAAEAIQFFIPTFKNEDFEEEQEIRLIFTPFPSSAVGPRFRVSKGMLIPYYSLKELDTTPSKCSLPITNVRVGPSINKRLNMESTRMLLANAGYSEVRVVSSGTPYRGYG